MKTALKPGGLIRFRRGLFNVLAVVMCAYVLVAILFPNMPPQQEFSKLSLFALLGLALVFLSQPMAKRWGDQSWSVGLDLVLCALSCVVFGYLIIHSDSFFSGWWIEDAGRRRPIIDRSGSETGLEIVLGTIGVLLVLEAARRSIGWTLAILSVVFLLFGLFGHLYPDWNVLFETGRWAPGIDSLFWHPEQNFDKVVAKGFLQNGGVIGKALLVMFKYVFLFVVFGSLLEATGATDFIIRFARRIFRNSVGGPAKVSVVSSGLMGSLSGSAVANTATTGTFTIPLMRSTGFDAETAGGVEAASSSGGALMPPIMGAGAYMMLELIEGVKYIEILQAAILPALLYYFAILLMVHWQAKRAGAQPEQASDEELKLEPICGLLFFGAFAVLIFLLLPNLFKIGGTDLPPGFTADKAASFCILGIIVLAAFHPRTRLGPKRLYEVCVKSARSGVILVAAAACVGIILGMVMLTGLGDNLPAAILSMSNDSLLLGLGLIMIATIILGMGLPSVVCYLLMATIIGKIIADFGTVEISMHLFIFYFSMMSMVTPPVALAAYAAAAISGGNVMKTAFKAFGFALVGFALPFAFVLKPELLMLSQVDGSTSGASLVSVVLHVAGAVAAIVMLAAAIVGYVRGPLPLWVRGALLVCSLVSFFTLTSGTQLWIHLGALAVGLAVFVFVWIPRGAPAKG